MGCNALFIKSSIKYKSHNDETDIKFIFEGLEEKGRLQFFYHSPSSDLSIRDVLNEQGKGWKTEPHLEIGAENYILCCHQPDNIVPLLKSKEKYLFLFTTCKNKRLINYYGKMFVVGYIIKQDRIPCSCEVLKNGHYCNPCNRIPRHNHYAIKGETKIFSFEDSYPLELLSREYIGKNNPRHIRKKLSVDETKQILEHFDDKKSILRECIEEIKDLDIKNNDEENKTCLVLRPGGKCGYKNQCLRWN